MSNFKSLKGAGNTWRPMVNADGSPKYHGQESIEGYYIDKKEGVGENNQNVYTLQLEDDTKTQIWGVTSLNAQMDEVRQGQYIRITWNGKKLTKVGMTKFTKVEDSIASPKMSFHDYEVGVSLDVPPMEMKGIVQKQNDAKQPTQQSEASSNPFDEKPVSEVAKTETIKGASSFASDSDLPF